MKRFHETKEYTYSALVDSYKRFLIPNFQRSYKWGNKQITDFFSAVDQNDQGYFIGNIVCVKGTASEENRLVIVDGQQRITTITLMLIALRDHIEEKMDVEKCSDLRKTIDWISAFLKDQDKKERKDYFLLKARKKSYNDVLADLIDGTHLDKKYDKAQLSYCKAYRTIKRLINDRVEGSDSILICLVEKVLDLEIVAIVLNSDKEVFNAFDGLNSKGLGLSTSDQIKNYLFSKADALGCLEDVELIWNDMETDFEKTNPDMITKFLRHLWISENKYVSGKDLYDVLKKDINVSKQKKHLISYCEKLLEYSKYYIGVKFKNFEHYLNDINISPKEVLNDFKILDNQQVYEILLALYKKSKEDKSFKPKYFRDISQLLWNFCLRTKYLIINPSHYERKFANYCELIRNTESSDILNKSKSFFEDLRKLTNNREQFIEGITEDLGYDSNPTLVSFLLKKIIEGKERNRITLTETSIEHILPQEPKQWGYTKKEIKEYVHNLGNLTLLHPKDNDKAKNNIMDIKSLQIYDKSHFQFNREITLYKNIFIDDYKEAIKQRGQDIAEQIYAISKL